MILTFDFSGSVPLYQQIRNQIVEAIAAGQLQPGQQLPTIRALADESGINMMTVSKAYQMLKQEGYIITDRRKGASVAVNGRTAVSEETKAALKLRITELGLSGLTKVQILQLCEQYYEEVFSC